MPPLSGQQLDLFGSAAAEKFVPEISDLDFIVADRPDADPDPWVSRYLELQAALDQLFGRPLNPVIDQSFRNPYFAEAVEQTQTVLYES